MTNAQQSMIVPNTLKADEASIPYVLSDKHQRIIDKLISQCGPEELYNMSEQLKKAAMDDVNSTTIQIEEDREKELLWLRK